MKINDMKQREYKEKVFQKDGCSPEVQFAVETVIELANNNFELQMLPLFQTPLYFQTLNDICVFLLEDSIPLETVDFLSNEINQLVLAIFYTSILREDIKEINHPHLPLGLIELTVQLFLEVNSVLGNYISLTHVTEITNLIYQRKINWNTIQFN